MNNKEEFVALEVDAWPRDMVKRIYVGIGFMAARCSEKVSTS